MDKCFEIIKKTRGNFLHLISGLSTNSLNEIPANFNNNIIWNLGHVIASQQILFYQYSNIQPKIEEQYIVKYKAGTKPENYIPDIELGILKHYLTNTIDESVIDFKNGLFKNYNSVTTRFGVEITNINDAVKYVSMHEGLHFGYAMALKRLIKE